MTDTTDTTRAAPTGIPDGYLKDARGALVPLAAIKPARMLEHELVESLAEGAAALNRALAVFKGAALQRVEDLRGLVAQEYGTTLGGAKGNITLSTFDGALQVQVQVSETMTFGPELASAKELIDGCVRRWSEGASDKLRALVDHAFQVNKEGRIDTQRVLSLRSLDMGDDAEWSRAMDAIADALRVHATTTYIRFYETGPNGVRQAIPLALAAV